MTAAKKKASAPKRVDVQTSSPIASAPSNEPSKAEVRLREIFAEVKFLHHLCEEAISNAKRNIPVGWHVDAEPESVRLDIGNDFQRMTADQAYAMGTHLILGAVLLDKRIKEPSRPRLSPFWLLEKFEELMRDWPRETR